MSLKKQFLKSKASCKVTFTLPKEAVNGGKEVVVLGEFNNWDVETGIPMKAAKAEYKAVLELNPGRHEFRYLIDKQTWENDWAADDYVATPYGVDNSVVFVPETAATIANAKPATKKAPAKKVAAKKTTTKKTTAKKATPAKDNLTKIEGIGPKISKLMIEDGITTFALLASATQAKLRGILDAAGPRFKMHDPTTWPKQAKLAANGKWDELKKLQDELKGGRA
ncbi:MAG: glycoside hydrolase family 13 [Bacteroidota bacterium]